MKIKVILFNLAYLSDILRLFFKKSTKSGTKLEVVVTKNLPSAGQILEIISARFLHDPKFIISINKNNQNEYYHPDP